MVQVAAPMVPSGPASTSTFEVSGQVLSVHRVE